MHLHHVSQRKDGRYEFTSEVGQVVRPVGYCAPYIPISLDDSVMYHPDWIRLYEQSEYKHHSHGHDTPEEAAECYRNYTLDNMLKLHLESNGIQRECKVCGKWTCLTASVGVKRWALCEKHNNREEVDKLYTLSPQTLIGEG